MNIFKAQAILAFDEYGIPRDRYSFFERKETLAEIDDTPIGFHGHRMEIAYMLQPKELNDLFAGEEALSMVYPYYSGDEVSSAQAQIAESQLADLMVKYPEDEPDPHPDEGPISSGSGSGSTLTNAPDSAPARGPSSATTRGPSSASTRGAGSSSAKERDAAPAPRSGSPSPIVKERSPLQRRQTVEGMSSVSTMSAGTSSGSAAPSDMPQMAASDVDGATLDTPGPTSKSSGQSTPSDPALGSASQKMPPTGGNPTGPSSSRAAIKGSTAMGAESMAAGGGASSGQQGASSKLPEAETEDFFKNTTRQKLWRKIFLAHLRRLQSQIKAGEAKYGKTPQLQGWKDLVASIGKESSAWHLGASAVDYQAYLNEAGRGPVVFAAGQYGALDDNGANNVFANQYNIEICPSAALSLFGEQGQSKVPLMYMLPTEGAKGGGAAWTNRFSFDVKERWSSFQQVLSSRGLMMLNHISKFATRKKPPLIEPEPLFDAISALYFSMILHKHYPEQIALGVEPFPLPPATPVVFVASGKRVAFKPVQKSNVYAFHMPFPSGGLPLQATSTEHPSSSGGPPTGSSANSQSATSGQRRAGTGTSSPSSPSTGRAIPANAAPSEGGPALSTSGSASSGSRIKTAGRSAPPLSRRGLTGPGSLISSNAKSAVIGPPGKPFLGPSSSGTPSSGGPSGLFSARDPVSGPPSAQSSSLSLSSDSTPSLPKKSGPALPASTPSSPPALAGPGAGAVGTGPKGPSAGPSSSSSTGSSTAAASPAGSTNLPPYVTQLLKWQSENEDQFWKMQNAIFSPTATFAGQLRQPLDEPWITINSEAVGGTAGAGGGVIPASLSVGGGMGGSSRGPSTEKSVGASGTGAMSPTKSSSAAASTGPGSKVSLAASLGPVPQSSVAGTMPHSGPSAGSGASEIPPAIKPASGPSRMMPSGDARTGGGSTSRL